MSGFNVSEILSLVFNNKMIKGTLHIPDSLFNRDLKMSVMTFLENYVDDYRIKFDDGYIFIQAVANLSAMGKIKANYRLKVEKFVFSDAGHRLSFSYSEDVKSMGNVMQNVALKAASINGSYIKTALEYGKNTAKDKRSRELLESVFVDNNTISLTLDSFDFMKAIPASMALQYMDAQNGALKFQIE